MAPDGTSARPAAPVAGRSCVCGRSAGGQNAKLTRSHLSVGLCAYPGAVVTPVGRGGGRIVQTTILGYETYVLLSYPGKPQRRVLV